MSMTFEELSRCKGTQGSLKQTANTTGVSSTSIKRLRIVLMKNSYRDFQYSIFVKRVFLEPQWFYYSCLKSQKTILDYYFNNNNCYNGISV